MTTDDDGAKDAVSQAEAARRRRLRERVFGEVLPDTTSDERYGGRPESGGRDDDDWLRSNVPPHHG